MIKGCIQLLISFFAFSGTLYSQSGDTIVDSRQTWSYFQNKFREEYSDSSKHKFTGHQKQEIKKLVDEKLILVNVAYTGYDNRIHFGQIICNQAVVSDVKQIFAEMLQLRFPIYQCKPVSEFNFIDTLSMQNNNTTCFDFRLKTSNHGLSNHSYGLAIDLNPVQNPYKKGNEIVPKNSNEIIATGRIRISEETGKKVINIFKKYGWTWGGNWRSLKDFMHFEKKTVAAI